jgi:hypothetical protein
MQESDYLKLPTAQRKQLQKQLQEQGLYFGPIDGLSGEGMRTAFKQQKDKAAAEAERKEASRLKEKELEIEATKATGQKATSEAEAERTRQETEASKAKEARRAKYNEDANSALGMTAQSAATLAAPALGTAGGLRFGKFVNERQDLGQERRNATLRGAAEDRVKGLTTREGAIKGTSLAGAMPYENRLLRVGSRMGAHLGLGALSAGKGAEVLSQYDEDQPFYPRMADRAAGLGYIGFGSGLIKRGIEQAAQPGVSPDAQALSIINSTQLRRNGLQGPSRELTATTIEPDATGAPKALPAPEAKETASVASRPGTKAYLLQQAKDLGIKGATRMAKADLADKVANKLLEHGGRRTVGPRGGGGTAAAIGAALGYMASPSDAQASPDGASITGNDQALTNAGVVGGIGYGTNRLLQAIPGALQGFNVAMIPSTVDAMTDYSPEELNQGRNWMARNLPSALHFGGVREAAEMSQVPSQRPNTTTVAKTPAPPADDFDTQMAELEALLSQMGGQADQAPSPVQNAVASQYAATLPAPNPAFPPNRLLASR